MPENQNKSLKEIYGIRFSDVWKADPNRALAGREVVVVNKNEFNSLDKIARAHGLSNWRELFPPATNLNKGFLEHRGTPHIVYPGDEIIIPKRQKIKVNIVANKENVIVAKPAEKLDPPRLNMLCLSKEYKMNVRVKVKDVWHDLRNGEFYTTQLEKCTDYDGKIKFEINDKNIDLFDEIKLTALETDSHGNLFIVVQRHAVDSAASFLKYKEPVEDESRNDFFILEIEKEYDHEYRYLKVLEDPEKSYQLDRLSNEELSDLGALLFRCFPWLESKKAFCGEMFLGSNVVPFAIDILPRLNNDNIRRLLLKDFQQNVFRDTRFNVKFINGVRHVVFEGNKEALRRVSLFLTNGNLTTKLAYKMRGNGNKNLKIFSSVFEHVPRSFAGKVKAAARGTKMAFFIIGTIDSIECYNDDNMSISDLLVNIASDFIKMIASAMFVAAVGALFAPGVLSMATVVVGGFIVGLAFGFILDAIDNCIGKNGATNGVKAFVRELPKNLKEIGAEVKCSYRDANWDLSQFFEAIHSPYSGYYFE
ncbi:hypothetical protein [Desulfoluna sp.]|uniref:hypothetical protein n=1 Tax=Desulfoluna sp. TaxID=2045199 RepID=UPI0026283C10|nr:hypothetical protein [Desulfoluna sp.]